MRGTLVRLAVWMTNEEHVMKRVASLWSTFNDEGEMRLLDVGDTASHIEVLGLKKPNALFGSILTGWAREVAVAIQTKTPIARHPLCRARGDARCVWEIRYASIGMPSKPSPTGDG